MKVVVMKNGQLIDTYNSDVPFGRYDDGRFPMWARD
jgi:hypothetical protein